MTDWFPWASKHGAINRTTGPDPAGGWARGAICWPHTLAAGRVGAAGCSWAARGAATSATAATASGRNQMDIFGILD